MKADKAKYLVLLTYRYCHFLVKIEKISKGSVIYEKKEVTDYLRDYKVLVKFSNQVLFLLILISSLVHTLDVCG